MKKLILTLIIAILLVGTVQAVDSESIDDHRMFGKFLDGNAFSGSYQVGTEEYIFNPELTTREFYDAMTLKDGYGYIYARVNGSWSLVKVSMVDLSIVDYTTDTVSTTTFPHVVDDYLYQIYGTTIRKVSINDFSSYTTWNGTGAGTTIWDMAVLKTGANTYVYAGGNYNAKFTMYDASNGNIVSQYAIPPPTGSGAYMTTWPATDGTYVYWTGGPSNTGNDTVSLFKSNATNVTQIIDQVVLEPGFIGAFKHIAIYNDVVYVDGEAIDANNLSNYLGSTSLLGEYSKQLIDNDYYYITTEDNAQIIQFDAGNLSTQLTTFDSVPGDTLTYVGYPTIRGGVLYTTAQGSLYDYIVAVDSTDLSDLLGYTTISNGTLAGQLSVSNDYLYVTSTLGTFQIDLDFLIENRTINVNTTTACVESWNAQYTTCINDTQTKYYEDSNSCGTTSELPIDNGTTVGCTTENQTTGGGGGGAFPEPETTPPQTLPTPGEETEGPNPFVDFGGLYEDFTVIFQKIFAGEITTKEITDTFNNYWLEIILLIIGLALLIYVGSTQLNKKNKGKGKKRRKKRK